MDLDKHLSVKVDSLTKIYPLYASPRDRLKETLHPKRKKYHKEYYALKNVSFEVNRGDSLGIIGQNGSGKSTLLKLLSRVLTPTSGSFQIKGRVISLLELGSGLNPELSGIENIYFYGTILGFSKSMIDSKLDEIIAFADIGQFIYQPLKTYSSGMSSRLAFSVASHVDPDVLILDEVLAVGDLRFKQKCFRVMRDIIDQDRTVMFVSHSTNAINDFCNKTIWLHNGEIRDIGPSIDVVKKYVGFMTYGMETLPKKEIKPKSVEQADEKQKKPLAKDLRWIDVSTLESFGEYGARIEKIALYHKETNQPVDILKGGEWLSMYAQISASKNIQSPGLGIRFKDKRGNGIFTVNNYLYDKLLKPIGAGETITIRTDFKLPLLMAGKYYIAMAFSDGDQVNHTQHHWIHDAMIVSIESFDPKFKRNNILVLDEAHYHIEPMDKQ